MKILRVILALVAGVFIGGIVNMALVMLGSAIVPAPAGVDVTNAESVAASAHLFQPRHFLFPFLAHAVGTLVGATAAHLFAGSYRNAAAWAIGAVFFAGGIAAARMIPAPTWFVVADLVLAYFPMAFTATRIGRALIERSTDGR
ncbi:hypothetical protein [Lentisalinibacter salinarum]|uniref:hypothetical protein n=1 Tax=Lentisalinibacter salinarum TaxID=2992239 RepID=UPI00386D3BA0